MSPRAVLVFRVIVTTFLAVSAIDDFRLITAGLGAILLSGLAYVAMIAAVWAPRLGILALVAGLACSTQFGFSELFILAASLVGFAIGVTRRWLWIVSVNIIWIAYASTVARSRSLLLWVSCPVVLVCAVLGVLVGTFHQNSDSLRRAAESLDRMSQGQAVRQLEEFAARLHDEIGYALASIALTASEAELASDGPEKSRFLEIRAIAATGSSNLAEVVGLLRDGSPGDGRPLEPPSQTLASMTETLRSCGFRVTADSIDFMDTLPISVRRLANRYLTEATTNVLKHAAQRSRITLTADWADETFDIVMTSTVASRKRAVDSGHGLAGLAEAAKRLDAAVTWHQEGRVWAVRLLGDLDEILGEE